MERMAIPVPVPADTTLPDSIRVAKGGRREWQPARAANLGSGKDGIPLLLCPFLHRCRRRRTGLPDARAKTYFRYGRIYYFDGAELSTIPSAYRKGTVAVPGTGQRGNTSSLPSTGIR